MDITDIRGLKLDENGKLFIPENIKRIKIDVGTSYCAPNAAGWLERDKNNEVFVIGIEPNRFSYDSIVESKRLYDPVATSIEHIYTDNKFMFLNCAIDNVNEIQETDFYHTTLNAGCSSLLKPTPVLNKKGVEIQELSKVTVTSFKSILELIPWDRFEYIEHVKTDCQGKDLGVFLSAGEYVKKFVYLDAEVSTYGSYENEINPRDVVNGIINSGFKRIQSGINCTFINKALTHKISEDNINYYTAGH